MPANEVEEVIKTPVRYDNDKGYIFDRGNKIVVDAHFFKRLPDPVTERIAEIINDHTRLVSENADYKKWLEFYGIEVYTDDEGVHTKFKPRTMDKWRQAQNNTELAAKDAEIERLRVLVEKAQEGCPTCDPFWAERAEYESRGLEHYAERCDGCAHLERNHDEGGCLVCICECRKFTNAAREALAAAKKIMEP